VVGRAPSHRPRGQPGPPALRRGQQAGPGAGAAPRLGARRRRRRGRRIDSGDVLFGLLDTCDPLVGAVLQQLGTTASAVQDRIDATEAA
ncbi:hypothetical protein A7K94_0220200, partial [Modestobacter sp. VKM Ac-2676]